MIDNIINQLIDIYHQEEFWHHNKLDRTDSYDYFLKMLALGNIILIERENKIVAYCEYWRITYEQLGRIICEGTLGFDEDKNTGNVCLAGNGWIHKDYRRGVVIYELRELLFARNKECQYYAEQPRRNGKGIRVFKNRSKIFGG